MSLKTIQKNKSTFVVNNLKSIYDWTIVTNYGDWDGSTHMDETGMVLISTNSEQNSYQQV